MQTIEKINSKQEKNRDICKQFSKTFYGEVKSIDSFPAGEPYKYLRKSPKISHPSHIRKAIASIDQTTVFQWSIQEIQEIETAMHAYACANEYIRQLFKKCLMNLPIIT